MKQRLSINADGKRLAGDPGEAEFVDWCIEAQLASVVIMDRPDICTWLYHESNGSVRPIDRAHGENDGAYWIKNGPEYKTPQQYGQSMIDRSPAGVWKYILNEPSAPPTHYDDWTKLLKWLIECGQYIESQGHRAVLGNIANLWEPHQIENGLFDGYLRYLAESSHHGGWHMYTGFTPIFGVGVVSYDDLRHPDRIQSEQWPARENLPPQRVPLDPSKEPEEQLDYWDLLTNEAQERIAAHGFLPPYWHLRRTDWFNIRCAEIGIPIHQKEITEGGVDRMPDLDSRFYRELEDRYGVPGPANEIRGAATLENVWRGWWSQWDFDEALIAQYEWWDHVLPADIEAVHWFTYAKDAPDWDYQFGCDISDRQKIRDLIAARAATGRMQVYRQGEAIREPMPAVVDDTPPEPPTEPPPTVEQPIAHRVSLRPKQTYANVRSEPRVSAPDIGDVLNGDILMVFTMQQVRTDNYQWVRIEWADGFGWLARQGFEDKAAYVVTLTPVKDEPPSDTCAEFKTEIKRLLGIIQNAVNILQGNDHD